MIVVGITALIVYLVTFTIEIFLSAFLLMATFKVIDPKLNKQEVRLGFTIALQLYSITYGLIMLAAIIGFITQSAAASGFIVLGAGIVYLVLLIKWYELDLGTLLLTWFVSGLLGGVFGALLSGFLAGLFSIVI